MNRRAFLLSTAAAGVSLRAVKPAGQWPSSWIACPKVAADWSLCHYRHSFDLAAAPASFVVQVSADNRYQLFVNGERVVWGPARGLAFHWRYETVDIARWLKPGRNTLAAAVWYEGEAAGAAQICGRAAFLLQGESVRTGKEWKCFANPAWRPLPVDDKQVGGYYAAPPGEMVDGSDWPWGWELHGFDDSAWIVAEPIEAPTPRGVWPTRTHWFLVPRPIPLMEETPLAPARLRRGEPVSNFTLAPHCKATVLLDQTFEATAYPELTVSGGKGARVTLRYAEALWIKGKRSKGHRDEIEGKELRGVSDVFQPDGGARRVYRPLYWRTWRYLEMEIETGAESLTIDDLRATATGYPFVQRARFESSSAELDRIREVGWRTARLCAHETYMDCPYYEQLQYAGDTRIQALVSIYETGDMRLMRNAIELLDDSRTSEGLIFSRSPSRLPQYIPPFALWWIGMVHDYWMYADDPQFVREMMGGVRAVLGFFERYQKPDGTLNPLPWWNFVDWASPWPNGCPPAETGGMGSSINLQLLLAQQWAAELENRPAPAQLAASIRRLYWDAGRGLFADSADKQSFSQHANALAVLAGVVRGDEARAVMEKTLADSSLTPASIYFRYYLHSAVREAGLGDRYLDLLGPWRDALKLGLTTWPEGNGPDSRSDCHAWGASPNIELFRTVLGIESAAPAFRRVRIRPHLGALAYASGSIPHPAGPLSVKLRVRNAKLQAEIEVPPGVRGEFEWRGSRVVLGPGRRVLSLPKNG